MTPPSARRRPLRTAHRWAAITAGGLFLLALAAVARVFTSGASPLPAALALYTATVAYGVGEMVRLRERTLFRPVRPPPPHSPLMWWVLRLSLVVVVSTLPAVLLLGGLTNR